MKSFNKYMASMKIDEALIKKNTSLNQISYRPNSKEELRKIIQKKIDKMNSRNSTNLHLADIDVSRIDNMNSLFMGLSGYENIKRINIYNWDTSNVESFSYMFALLDKLEEIIGIEDINTSNVESFDSMFLECKKLKKIDISKWNTSKSTVFTGMFKDCKNLSEIIGIENIDISNAYYTTSMFHNCASLEKIDINNWKTDRLYSMALMFKGCKKLKQVRIGKINMENVSSIESLFENCNALADIDDLSNWDLQSLRMGNKAFKKCYNLVTIKGLDNWFKISIRQQKKDLSEMFSECVNLKDIGDIGYWKFVRNKKNMFNNTNIENIPEWYYR